MRGIARCAVAPIAMLVGCLAFAPATAFAGVGLGMTPTFAPNAGALTVGQTNLPASLTVTNSNTAPEAGATVCNVGDPAPCSTTSQGIVLVPSCAGQGENSVCSTPDANVFRVNGPGKGAAGTTCAAMDFTIVALNDPLGSYRFIPTSGNVVLPQIGSSCRIDFTIDVLRAPAVDALAATAGLQTLQTAEATQRSDTRLTGSSRGSLSVTVAPAPVPAAPAPAPVAPPAPPAPNVASSAPVARANISGPSGCVSRNFNVQVYGTSIRRVVFRLDGRRILTLNRPTRGRLYRVAIKPGLLSRGRHRVTALTTFTASSGAPARTLRLVFQRCSRARIAPRFTG